MIKTYRLPVVAMAQGLSTGTGYTSEYFRTGEEYYENTNYPITIQLAELPNILKNIVPYGGRLHIKAGVESGRTYSDTISGEYNYSPILPGDGGHYPSDAELKQLNESKPYQYEWVGFTELVVKNDILNGIYSNVTDKNYYFTSKYIPVNISTGAITRVRDDRYDFNYHYSYPYTVTYTGYNFIDVEVDNYFTQPRMFESTKAMLENGVLLRSGHNYMRFYSEGAYLDIDYNAGALTTITDGPIGYVDETGAISFSWHTTWSGFPMENVEQTSATLRWKNGTDGEIHEIQLSGAGTSYTMSANTLPQSQDIRWQVTAVTAEGTSTSAWATIQTADAVPTVTAVSPSGTFVDNTREARFAWEYFSETGAPQKAYDLQVYSSGTWQTVKSETTENTYADVVPGTLPAGTVQWRVRGYNQDDIASEWSEPKTAVIIAAPPAPQVIVTSSAPLASVRWTSVGQQAYQVVIGDYDSGLIYGTDKTFASPNYLPDGRTEIKVRVMNAYGYWSPYGSAFVTIANTAPDTAPTLTVEADTDAVLTWTDADADIYGVYRDGVRIARTTELTYTDRAATGRHTYRVRAGVGANYADSESVTVDMATDYPIIALYGGGGWLSLEYTVSSTPQITVSTSADIAFADFNNAVFPIPEKGRHRRRSMALSVGFKDRAEADRFGSLLGELVIYKNQYGHVIVGIMTAHTRTENEFWVSYDTEITEVDPAAYA